ncbi:hypothetical protein SLEP1_g55177 [Rubroshorea leprosula]|uniref:Uncharacterized protein n=1 Tax=Rubroshorea leprosula TaxID=152421 RepID=A0AAV5MH36_9ROSI|nr:hypothetical protein SLEP1_g55177 [Rubroshorea leprosula]
MQGHYCPLFYHVIVNKVLIILMRPGWKEMKASESNLNAVLLQRQSGPPSAKRGASGCITLLNTKDGKQLSFYFSSLLSINC